MSQPPPEPRRSQSTTSLYRLYNGASNGQGAVAEEELQDPRLDFCNAFWGPGDRGFEVIMTRLRGAGRTVDELKSYWKERASIEEDYAKRLNKLSRTSLGKDEVGDLADALQHLLQETAQQASYHLSLSNEIKSTVEVPTSELSGRMSNLKRGVQMAIEKAHRNKGLQEGYVQKAQEKYEQDCLKLNSYTAQSSLTQGKELERLLDKLDRVRGTIGKNEQDFRMFVRALEGTHGKWEQEWKNFCDHAQDLEEDRMGVIKDLIWVYANAVSQVCVEDDSSCERIREKLEQYEPQNDMVNFVKGWGTGDMIPDAPRFINYSAGESYPTQPTFHVAQFNRISQRPVPVAPPQAEEVQPEPIPEPEKVEPEPDIPPAPPAEKEVIGISNGLQRTTLRDEPVSSSREAPASDAPAPAEKAFKPPFGGIAMPGLSSNSPPPPAACAAQDTQSARFNAMPPPPVPSMTMPEPRVPSRQGPPSPARDVNDEEDPMAKALADLRREPPPPGSVRRNASHIRRPDSAAGSIRGSVYGQSIKSPTSPGPNRMSFQQTQGQPGPGQSRSPPIDSSLSPPPGGHTAAALARSMDEFRTQSSRGPESNPHRQSVNYSNFADDIVGSHPTSRPSTPSAAPRAPSPAMMQAPRQPATHIADEVLSQYHQAFPGERERSRSRAGSVMSNRSRGSYIDNQQGQQAPPSPGAQPREGFVGIGAGNAARSPSPQPPAFRSPSPSPVMAQGSLGPQNLGIALDAKGGVAQDTMAEQYRRQFQQQQQQQQPQQQPQQQGPPPQPLGTYPGQRGSTYGAPAGPGYGGGSSQGHAGQQGYPDQSQNQRGSVYGAPTSPAGPPAVGVNRPLSGYGGQQPPPQQQQQYASPANQYNRAASPAPPAAYQSSPSPAQAQPPHPSYGQYPQQTVQPVQSPGYPAYAGQPSPAQPQQAAQPPQPAYNARPTSVGAGGYPNTNGYAGSPNVARGVSPQPQASQMYAPPQQQTQQYAPPANHYTRAASPAPQQQQQQQQQQAYGGGVGGYNRGVSPQPGAIGYGQQAQGNRSPSPQPNQPPPDTAPTGQWSTTGLPVLFYVKAVYDYTAETSAEFDFQAGDIIAVTSTPEDGWWSGELLDEARRVPGRTDFPSNFVTLF